jgi:hypothetical protein
MSGIPDSSSPNDLIAFVERDIGTTLSEDARFLIRLAVNLGIARANERDIPLGVCASWINLVGAALLARDPTSCWLQETLDAFDVDEVLPGSPARARAIRLAADQKDASNELPEGDRPAFLSTSAMDQLKAAVSIAAPALGDPPVPSAGIVQALHIIASLIFSPVGAHGTEAAVGRGDAQKRSEIQNHMARWLADNALAFDPAWRDTGFVSYLQGAETIFSTMRPELAAAAGINPKDSFNDWIGRVQEWVPPYSPSNLSIAQWRASGPLGRILDGRFAPNAGSYPLEWAPFLDLLREAVGEFWRNDVPGEGGPLAGRGLSLLQRALALASLVLQPIDYVMGSIDLYHLIGAVFAPPEAALPPAFEPFPAFRFDLPPIARQTLRRRFLVLVAQHPRESERLSVWADVILGERLVTARIPTDLGPSEDLLGFSRYAKAFASVIADRAVSPPLAIGLFGIWGSGKSSMIDLISNALADIDIRAALDQELRFCRGIVRITFNAWHYAETNLWASIFVRILEEMAHHLRSNPTLVQLDVRSLSLLALENAQKEKQAADTALAEAELTVARVAQEAATVEQDLTAARQAEAEAVATQAKAVAAAQADEATRFNALEIASDAAALLFSFGRPTLEDLAGDDGKKLADTLKEQRDQISTVTKTFKEMSDPLKRLQLILGWERSRLLYLILVVAVAIPVALFIWLAVKSGVLAGIAASALSVIAILTGAFTTLAPLWARGREAIVRAPAIMTKLADAAKQVKERAEEREAAAAKAKTASEAAATENARQTTATAIARAKSTEEQAAAAGLAVATARAKVEAARQVVTAAEARTADMAPERLLRRFVEDRAASDDYGRQLGLPTRIRRDLDTLRGYLDMLTKANAERHADRIVLFIDDLDRCAPPVVVKVLEAVQILLASDLFVVVVGVDVRWLTKSLATHHAGQFGDEQILNPEDFLEKIFQVPFWIPGLSVAGSQAVVKNALPEVREKEQGGLAPEAGAPPPPAQGTLGGGSGQGGANFGAPSSEAAPLPTLEPVDLTSEEHAALLRWGVFAGDTPRRLKRFARSYLILRASLPPAERDTFIADSEFDTVARLLAFNTADPDHWSSFAAFVSSGVAPDWKQNDFGAVWKQLFVETAEPPAPAPAACRPWLAEVERFGFAVRSQTPSTHEQAEPQR